MKILFGCVAIIAMAVCAAVTLGYAIEEGGKLAPSRIKLAAAIEKSGEANDRLRSTLQELITSNCTWNKP